MTGGTTDMKDSKFWRFLAVMAVVGLFLNVLPQRESSSISPAAPMLDMLSTVANAQAPLVESFEEQQHAFLSVWNTDEDGNLHYRVLRWQKGTLRSKVVPELRQHTVFGFGGQITVLVELGQSTGRKIQVK
jgi:hypothetical protein